MDSEGIYRRSGGAGQTREIQQLFDQGKVPDLTDDVSKWNDISAITSVLKLYFRNLPDPLFTFALHDNFIQAIRKCGGVGGGENIYKHAGINDASQLIRILDSDLIFSIGSCIIPFHLRITIRSSTWFDIS